jgi:glycosyltransferase involved in cell wall biosynthesis
LTGRKLPVHGRKVLKMEDILYDARWVGPHGIGRFADEILKRLGPFTLYKEERPPSHPADPALLAGVLWCRRPKLFFSPGYNAPVTAPCPFVFTLHDLHHLRVPEDSSVAKRAYYRHIIRPACQRAAFVLTVSEFSKQEIMEWSGVREDKVVNVRNGVGPPFVREGTKHDPGYPYLLYVGSTRPNKNLPRLLTAFAISKVLNEVRLILAGRYCLSIESEIERLGLQGKVTARRCDSDEELASLYRGARALVFPSLYEGFGLPVLEAMACGTPVLASNVTAVPEVAGDAALLVDPTDVRAIAEGIERIVQDEELRSSLREKGIRRASLYSWDETARRTWEVLQSAMDA